MTETCPKTLWRGSDWGGRRVTCGKPVKRLGLCGVHARQLEADQDREQQRAIEDARRKDAAAVAAMLKALTGLDFFSVHDRVVIHADGARDLVTRLSGRDAVTTSENTHQPRVARRLRGGAYQWVAVCGTHWERIARNQAHALRLVALHNENPNSDGKR